jgi:hypothetical protein
MVCEKCRNISANFCQCFFCMLTTFYVKIDDSSSITSGHADLACSHDFCDFSNTQADDMVKFNCKHRACLMGKKSQICGYCSISKLFKEIKAKENIKPDAYLSIQDKIIADLADSFEPNLEENEQPDDSHPIESKLDTEEEEEHFGLSHMDVNNNIAKENIKGHINQLILDEQLPGFQGYKTIELKLFVSDDHYMVITHFISSCFYFEC